MTRFVTWAILVAFTSVTIAVLPGSAEATPSACEMASDLTACGAGGEGELTLDLSDILPGADTADDLDDVPQVTEVDTSLPQPQLDPETLDRLQKEYSQHVTECANAQAGGDQEYYQANCVEDEPTGQDQPDAAPEPPPVTPDIVRRQLEAIQLPPGEISFQPDGRALVNKEVIFYSETPRNDTYDLQILGRSVRASIHVVSYHWDWGDGQTLTTKKPGAPYPSFDVSHIYEDTGIYTVELVLDYTATFQVAGGPTVTVPGVVSAPPSSVDLPIVSASTVLVDPDD